MITKIVNIICFFCFNLALCEIEVSFKKEGHLDEDVIITSQIDELKTLHSIKSSVDNRELSRIRINWIKI